MFVKMSLANWISKCSRICEFTDSFPYIGNLNKATPEIHNNEEYLQMLEIIRFWDIVPYPESIFLYSNDELAHILLQISRNSDRCNRPYYAFFLEYMSSQNKDKFVVVHYEKCKNMIERFNGHNLFGYACEYGNLFLIQYLVSRGCIMSTSDYETLVSSGNLEAVVYYFNLIKPDSNIFLYACSSGNIDVMNFFYEKGLYCELLIEEYYEEACFNLDAISWLWNHEFGKTSVDRMHHVIHRAAAKGCYECVKFLDERGFPSYVNYPSVSRGACMSDDIRLVKFIHKKGCVSFDDICSTNIDIFVYLRQIGVPKHSFRNAISYAIDRENLEVVKYLMSINVPAWGI